jgi:hypothetical protein
MGGSYVQKAGDTMTGTLNIQSTNGLGLSISQLGAGGTGLTTEGAYSGLVASGTAYAALFYGGSGGSVISYANAQYTSAILGQGVGPHTYGGSFVGTEYGLFASGTVYGLYSKGTQGGGFQGTNIGLSATANGFGGLFSASASNGKGLVVTATGSTAIAGEFIGGSIGVSSTGATVGVAGTTGQSLGSGVRGDNDFYGGYGMLGYSNYGVYGNGTWWGGSFYGTTGGVRGADNDTGIYGILGYNGYSLYGNGDVYSSGNGRFGSLDITGEVTADTNTLSNCAWTAYVADGAALTCPATNHTIMHGIQRSGTTMRANCCDL